MLTRHTFAPDEASRAYIEDCCCAFVSAPKKITPLNSANPEVQPLMSERVHLTVPVLAFIAKSGPHPPAMYSVWEEASIKCQPRKLFGHEPSTLARSSSQRTAPVAELSRLTLDPVLTKTLPALSETGDLVAPPFASPEKSALTQIWAPPASTSRQITLVPHEAMRKWPQREMPEHSAAAV